MRRTKRKLVKSRLKNPYLHEKIKLVKHWTERNPSCQIPIGKTLKVVKTPINQKYNCVYLWVKYKGKKIRLLLSEVVFIDPIPVIEKNTPFKRTKKMKQKKITFKRTKS